MADEELSQSEYDQLSIMIDRALSECEPGLFLKPLLYEKLIRDHGFGVPDSFRTPGYVDGVVLNGVEIAGFPLPQGLSIYISVPVDAREDDNFSRWRDMGKTFLAPRKPIFATIDNLEEQIRRVVELAKHGAAVFYFNRDKVI